MTETRLLMGMPITVTIVDINNNAAEGIPAVFHYFEKVDEQFSPYKKDSEVSRINRKEIQKKDFSSTMQEVLQLSEETKQLTNGYFDVFHDGVFDPSGLVKGWAIYHAAKLLKKKGFKNFYINAGGDVQVAGKNEKGKMWTVGIQHPFKPNKIVKKLAVFDKGVATSGTYVRGNHIYTPHIKDTKTDIVSLTVIGPNIYEADRFATAAFAMGKEGLVFLSKQKDLAGYMIDARGIATYTAGFEKYVTV